MGTIGTQVGILLGKIAVRKRIDPADLDEIRNLYEQWRLHDHTYYDLHFLAFQNTPPKPTASSNEVTEVVKDALADVTPIEGGHDGYAAFADGVFELIDNFNNYVHTHAHDFEDTAT